MFVSVCVVSGKHVPDIVEIDAIDTLYETKIVLDRACKEKQTMGHGSAKKGGAYSENEGSHIAFGGTAEHARHLTLGCEQRGRADQRPFDRPRHRQAQATSRARHRGHYHDALSHHRHVAIVLVETTGAVHPDTVGMLYAWHNEARSEGHADRPHRLRQGPHCHALVLCAPSASHLASSGHRCRAAGSAVGQGGQE